jgi:paired small multidrug resistance pump
MRILKNPWLWIIIAVIFEDGWVAGIKYANTWFEWLLTLAALGISLGLFLLASEKLPVGTVYAVFAGLGATATVLTSVFIFHTPITIGQIIFLLILMTGIIGLKFITEEKK